MEISNLFTVVMRDYHKNEIYPKYFWVAEEAVKLAPGIEKQEIDNDDFIDCRIYRHYPDTDGAFRTGGELKFEHIKKD